MYAQEHRWGPFTLALMIAAGIVLGGIALSAAFWILGILAGVVFALFRVAVLVAVAAAIVWLFRLLFTDRQRV